MNALVDLIASRLEVVLAALRLEGDRNSRSYRVRARLVDLAFDRADARDAMRFGNAFVHLDTEARVRILRRRIPVLMHEAAVADAMADAFGYAGPSSWDPYRDARRRIVRLMKLLALDPDDVCDVLLQAAKKEERHQDALSAFLGLPPSAVEEWAEISGALADERFAP